MLCWFYFQFVILLHDFVLNIYALLILFSVCNPLAWFLNIYALFILFSVCNPLAWFCFKYICSVYFIFSLWSSCISDGSEVYVSVDDTFKCHSWPNGFTQPPWQRSCGGALLVLYVRAALCPKLNDRAILKQPPWYMFSFNFDIF